MKKQEIVPLTKITLELIDHSEQPYNTVGDWRLDPDDPSHLLIKGSRLRTARVQPWPVDWAVPLHELCESLACLAAGVTPDEVDAFDFEHEHDEDEPGDNRLAPYHTQHVWATHVEKVFVTDMLQFDWDRYETLIDRIWLKREKQSVKQNRRKD